MAKYGYRFKKKLVLEYLKNRESYSYISRKYGIASDSQLRTWVAAYKSFGDEGLKRSRSCKFYSFEEKLSVVESYLTSECSYQETALRMGINNPSMVARWVSEFKTAGSDALRPHQKGRQKTLSELQTDKEKSQGKQTVVDSSIEHVKELEGELQRLRLENAFLKELRRLRLEDEAKMRELQKSSAVSEDHSN